MSELRRLFHPLTARDRDEPHRTATPLELFTDLCVVVAVAQAGTSLHHAIVDDRVASGLSHYALVFFAIYWAWLNFTWFASAYDNDDVGYRLLTLLQVVGVLILAAGVPRAFDDHFATVVLGYVVMRIALVIQWIRVSYDDPACRQTALRYAVGITVMQLGWVLMLAVPDAWRPPVIVVLVTGELLTPAWAEAAHQTQWHPRHIAERYGLLTIIVLGESILAATVAIQKALDEDTPLADLGAIVAGGVLTVFSMWWLYFAKDAHRVLVDNRIGFRFGYIHYFIFGAGAAVGAGLVVQVEQSIGHTEIGDTTAAAALTIPVVLYLAATWFGHLALHESSAGHGPIVVAASILILLATFAPEPGLITGLVCAVMVATLVIIATRRESADQP